MPAPVDKHVLYSRASDPDKSANQTFFLRAFLQDLTMMVEMHGLMAEKLFHISLSGLAFDVKSGKKENSHSLKLMLLSGPSLVEKINDSCSWTGSVMGFVLCTSLPVVKSLNCCSSLARTFWTVVADTSSTISLMSKAKRHSPSSSNGLPVP